MRPDISEFSYGYALTSELIHYYEMALTGAPAFPTTNEEGQTGGHDVELPRPGVPLFLQFKRSDCMVRSTAAQAQAVGIPHYRFHLRPLRHSDQHPLLLKLERDGNEVYYAAPRFHTRKGLNDAYFSHQVAQRSAFVAPSWIGDIRDNGEHYVAVSRDDTQRRFCSSEHREIKAVRAEIVLRQRVQAAVHSHGRRIDDSFYLELGDRLVEGYVGQHARLYSPERIRAAQLRSERRPAEYAREVTHMLYGCELLIALESGTPLGSEPVRA